MLAPSSGRPARPLAPWTAPEPGDRVVEGSGIPIFVAPQIVDRLSRPQIDISEKNGKPGLVLRPQGRAKGGVS